MLFEPGKGKMIGEITPAYSTLGPDDVRRVHRLVPDARIIFMMRNPVERVWSQAVMGFDRSEGKAVDAVRGFLRHAVKVPDGGRITAHVGYSERLLPEGPYLRRPP